MSFADCVVGVCLLVISSAAVVHTVALIRLVRADAKEAKGENEAKAKKNAEWDAFMADMHERQKKREARS